jgi:hypothetical protein
MNECGLWIWSFMRKIWREGFFTGDPEGNAK